MSKSAPLTASIVGRILRKSLGDDPRKNEIMRHLLSAQDKYLRDSSSKPICDAQVDQTRIDLIEAELASMTRMFHAACDALGLISEALGLDPDDGGAEPILDAIAELKGETPTTPSPISDQAAGFDMLAHLARQRAWSELTFGPGARTKGVVDHIRKELTEIEADPTDLMEWIDVVILALDGAWRAGGSPEQIISTMVAKQTKNESRAWPDWRTADPDKAIEHDRAKDTAPTTGSAPEASTSADAWTDDRIRQLALEAGHRMGDVWLPFLRGYANAVLASAASPAASVLSEDAILAIAIDHGLGTAVVESIVKALLAASIGGAKS